MFKQLMNLHVNLSEVLVLLEALTLMICLVVLEAVTMMIDVQGWNIYKRVAARLSVTEM
jgi:hypothetical protein